MLYEHGDLAGDRSFDELKSQALINSAARASDQAPDFSDRIREDRSGFKESKTIR
jgi:hypothetical protein